MNSTCASRYGRHDSISSGSGSRLPGGRHFTTLAMYTVSRSSPIPSIRLVSSRPARPTNGIALEVLLLTGTLADEHAGRRAGSPAPNTTCVRVSASGHLVHASASRSSSANDANECSGSDTVGHGRRRCRVIGHGVPRIALGRHIGRPCTRSRSSWASTSPVAAANAMSPSWRVCDGCIGPHQPWWALSAEELALELRAAERWSRRPRRAWCAGLLLERVAARGSRGAPAGAVEPGEHAARRSSTTSPTAFTTASAPTTTSPSRALARAEPTGHRVLARPATCRRSRRDRRRPARSASGPGGSAAAAASAARPSSAPGRHAARRRRGRRSRPRARSAPARRAWGTRAPRSASAPHHAVGGGEPERRAAREHDRVDVLRRCGPARAARSRGWRARRRGPRTTRWCRAGTHHGDAGAGRRSSGRRRRRARR